MYVREMAQPSFRSQTFHSLSLSFSLYSFMSFFSSLFNVSFLPAETRRRVVPSFPLFLSVSSHFALHTLCPSHFYFTLYSLTASVWYEIFSRVAYGLCYFVLGQCFLSNGTFVLHKLVEDLKQPFANSIKYIYMSLVSISVSLTL